MAWRTPKTDWSESDYFNIGDYNRIVDNLAALRNLAASGYAEFKLEEMTAEKTYSDYIYADEINVIESNLAKICNSTYQPNIGEQRTYYANQPTPDWREFNRIESACLTLYKNLQGQLSGKRRLSFRLGGELL